MLPYRDRRERAARSGYLDAIRLLYQLLYARPADSSPSPQLELPAINQAEPGYTREELHLAAQPVTWLVDELVRADPRYTLRRSLMHLRRGKLARMLVKARSAATQQERRSA